MSEKHGRWLDEKLAHQVRALVQGNPGGTRAEEWRRPEPPADGEPVPSQIPPGHYGANTGDDRDPDLRDQRALIGSYLPRDVFPTRRKTLLDAAAAQHAPEEVLTTLRGLPAETTFTTAHDLWAALNMPSGPRF